MFNFTSSRIQGKRFEVKKALDKAVLEGGHKLTIFEVTPPNEGDYEDEDEFAKALERYEANPKYRGVVSDHEGESFNVSFARSFTSMSFGTDRKGGNVDFDRYCSKYGNPSGCKTPKEAKLCLEGYILYVTSGLRKDGSLATDKNGAPIKYNCYLGAPKSSDFAIDPDAEKIFDELDKLAASQTKSSSSNNDEDEDDF